MMEEQYLQIANDSPNILCSQVPAKVLEAAIADATEPSESYADFLQTGHTQWLLQKYGRVPRGKAEIRNAVVVLWMRACRLHSNNLLGRHPDPDWDKPFFSDEGLYE